MVASLDAMVWEANRCGITYGELVAHLKLGEETDIARRYKEHQNEKRLQAAERAAKKAEGEPSRRWRRKKKKEE